MLGLLVAVLFVMGGLALLKEDGGGPVVGIILIIIGCLIFGFLNGLATFTMMQFVEIVMNTIPDFNVAMVDDFLKWWKDVKEGTTLNWWT